MTDEQARARLVEWGQWRQGATATGYPRTSTLHQSWQPGRGRGQVMAAGSHGHAREREVDAVVRALSAKQRDVLVAQYVSRWGQALACSVLGCCTATLRARQQAALALVAQGLSQRRDALCSQGV